MKRYVKKKTPVEAIEFTGSNINEIIDFFGIHNFELANYYGRSDGKLPIKTLEGTVYASVGDYIVKGVYSEVYPCKKFIFENTYEEFNEEE